ncbi:hypothetical protein BGZ80_000268 [Entomortierella chlamydospora]|uniref:Uncharacterized protein n=1 Tax=Entomortierella chlamydospora TaxID=101097 RepID=A0A9P6T3M4_9FUNG|nr:hypothetical protein BGZ79_008843 [Entomortierella chlamydospora]KAG0022429.1 hypothetical protein BGZ80_000268 [Entomortierella chlamydospora]
MLTSPNPQREFVECLFERLLFERILACNHPNGCCIDPAAISNKFDFILEYYSLGLRKVHDLRSEVVQNLGLHTTTGTVIHLTNMQGRYKIFPASLEATFEFSSEKEDEYGHHVQCRAMSNKQIKEFHRDYASKVSKEYRDEIELLVNILNANGLISPRGCGSELDELSEDDEEEDEDDEYQATEDRYVTKLEKARGEAASSARGVNISDYDVELLLVKPAQKPPPTKALDSDLNASLPDTLRSSALKPGDKEAASVMTMSELSSILNMAGFKSVQHSYRYTDNSCEMNVPYTSFYDHRSELTCQITLNHPLGVPLRNLIQAYADIDDRLEGLVYAIQQILTEHGRCYKFLSNYAIALMAIAYLQEEEILPKLQHHSVKDTALDCSNQSALQDQQKPGQSKQQKPSHQHSQYKPVTPAMSKNQKRANARQNRRIRNMASIVNSSVSGSAVDTVQVQTPSGATRNIDCRFDKVMAKDRSFGKQNDSSVGDLMMGFLSYFVLEHEFRSDHEVSVTEGSLGHQSTPGDGTNATSRGLSINVGTGNATNVMSAKLPNGPENGSKPEQSAPRSESKPSSTPKTAGNASAAATANPKQKNNHLCGLFVRDPFVTDRNTTKLCTGWKFKATRECFDKAFETLNGLDDGSLLDDFEAYMDSDDDSSDEGVEGNGSGRGRNEHSRPQFSDQSRQQLTTQKRDRLSNMAAETEKLLSGMIFLTLSAEQSRRF